jgi:hypothetical protein
VSAEALGIRVPARILVKAKAGLNSASLSATARAENLKRRLCDQHLINDLRETAMTKQKSVLLTAALAGLLISGSHALAEDNSSAAVGECHGINSCKGKGACAGEGNSCKGQNSCKGKGWTKLTKTKCEKKKGTFKEMAKHT